MPDSLEPRRILITGSTGFLGRMLMRELLRSWPETEVWAVARPAGQLAPHFRPELAEFAATRRFHVVSADLSKGDLGDQNNGGLPRTQFDICFHLAAQTEFRERFREQTFRSNVEGTRNLVAMLETLPGSPKLYHISTAYVCGTEAGVSPEALLQPRQFVNPYEESKHRAEAIVAASRLDWTILRPSILMGDSRTGDATTDKMTYGVFRAYWRLREVLRNKYTSLDALSEHSPYRVECDPAVTKNLICIDDVVRLILALCFVRPAAGTVFHLTNPAPVRLDAIHAAAFNVLQLRCVQLSPIIDGALCAEERLLRRGLDVYRPYLTTPEAIFDQSALRAVLGNEAVDTILPMSQERLRFLYSAYLQREQERARAVSQTLVTVVGAVAAREKQLGFIRQFGRGAIAYMSLSNGTTPLFLPDNRGFVAYATKGRSCVMVGDPICAASDCCLAVTMFLNFCAAHALDAVAVQVNGATGEFLVQRGGHLNRIGDEAILHLPSFDLSLAGPLLRRLRKNRNTARNHGIAVRQFTYTEIPVERLERVSQAWLSRKINKRELSLLVRPLPRFDEADVRKFGAFRGEELVGVVVFNPLFADGSVCGFTADIERYERKPGGIHDLLLLEGIRAFTAEGLQVLNLGLAPLGELDGPEHPSHSAGTRDLLIRIRDETAPVYNFCGISRHKNIFQPAFRPMYMWTQRACPGEQILDVFNLIGLLPPEALLAVTDETFAKLQ